ncbi:molybdenum cofactor guanylyltransferase [Paenibacillus mucilaginosus]|uniref:Molybdopterin-guanine dinucleotide biosynthesis protein A n=1 Tax=Paenibacillus mucilaginosus (strain KNP414) TaxID=1036673 RepID=F8FBE0_PAEMK|nr:molybdenum cofactor guanylyltransferase [Paenibacillus mucilaginosus]AEI42507.1 molybdopterin-guanine dinucleotide biosynthesis protein A [Paenibacillus mucilaginosus KNP414]MCG7213900.1 molybdenum cofactor guanylyltransferase [Paenibacillus mucilaginosus]WDM25906.1 molybdenum cofactor guanylyltransferase [Paenibacillus mucilaginosus]
MMTGIILAGGVMRRLRGREAGLLPYAEGTILERQLQVMESCCSEIILVTDDPRRYLEHVPRHVRVLADYYEGRGPLGGLHAGVALAQNNAVWVTGYAMPCVSPQAALRLLERMTREGNLACLPKGEQGLFPLHGVFSTRCLDPLEEVLQGEASVQEWSALLDRLTISAVDEAELAAEGIEPGYMLRVRHAEDYWRALAQDAASRQ